MNITRFEELDKSKIKVYIDDEYAFILYEKDIEHLRLDEGISISQDLYDNIIDEIVYPRAQQKALAILKYMDRSEQEVRNKLSRADYVGTIIDRTIAYVKEYGYLDDERFTAAFIRARMNRKSKLMIKTELMQKGINKDTINSVLLVEYGEDEEEDAELNAIRKAIAKKTRSPEALTYEEKQKLIASLYRKGFNIGKIKQIL